MEAKTCRFGTILDSATRSTSCRQFFEIHFRCGESPTLLPFEPLILTPRGKIVDDCLPLRFCRQFFFVHVPDIIGKMNSKKTASQNKISIKFYIRQWTVENVRTNIMVTPCQKTTRHVFMFSSEQLKKSAPGAVQYCRLHVDYLSKMKSPPSCMIKESDRTLKRIRWKTVEYDSRCLISYVHLRSEQCRI